MSNSNNDSIGFGSIGMVLAVIVFANYNKSGGKGESVKKASVVVDNGPSFWDSAADGIGSFMDVLLQIFEYAMIAALVGGTVYVLMLVFQSMFTESLDNVNQGLKTMEKKTKHLEAENSRLQNRLSDQAETFAKTRKKYRTRIKNICEILGYDAHIAAAKAAKEVKGDSGDDSGSES